MKPVRGSAKGGGQETTAVNMMPGPISAETAGL